MKRTLTLTSAALLGASLLASPVMAQVSGSATGNTGIGASVGTGGSNADVSGTVGASGDIGSGSTGGANANVGASGSANADASTSDDGSASGSANGGANATADADTDDADGNSSGNATGNSTATASGDDSDDEVDDSTTASTGDMNNGFDGFMQAIGSDEGMQGILGFEEGQAVTIVRADAFCESDLEQQCIDAMNANQARSAEIQGAISENAMMSAALGSQNVDVSSVVAARTNADGSVTVFTQ